MNHVRDREGDGNAEDIGRAPSPGTKHDSSLHIQIPRKEKGEGMGHAGEGEIELVLVKSATNREEGQSPSCTILDS